MNKKPDCSGWATRTNIKCTDGRTILEDAFAENDGKQVPVVWSHQHNSISNVLGHAILTNKKGGVWADLYFNNTENGQIAKEVVSNKDIGSLSIFASGLKYKGKGNVAHGDIKEVSLVVSGANMGATIQNVSIAHGEGMEESEEDAVIWNDDDPQYLNHSEELSDEAENHEQTEEPEASEQTEEESDTPEPEADETDRDEDDQQESEPSEDEADGLEHSEEGKSAPAIWNSLNDDQKNLFYYMIGRLQEDSDESEESDEAEHSDENGEDFEMKKNVFEGDTPETTEVLSHAEQVKIINRAKKLGSMQQAWQEALESNESLAHAVYNDNGTEQKYGIANIDYLFPDYQTLDNTPDKIRRDDDWVNVVMNGVRKTPFARIKTIHANITMDEARAKGYIKGNEKKEEVFNLLKRTVDPQTVYKKQKFDKDDVDDITDFDVIAWTKAEMMDMLHEEIARAILIGDGRDVEDADKIKTDHIKPIWTDDDMYAIKVNVTAGADNAATAKNALAAMIRNRKKYKGSGNLVFFTSEDWVAEWLLLEDGFGHPLYKTMTELATKLRVNRVVTVPQFEGLARTVGGTSKALIGIAVDLKDYATGSNKRGKVDMFDDFDIDFNQLKYLIETRLSGMLTKPFSAMILEVSASGVTYSVAEPANGANPKELGYFEKEGDVYRKSADTEVKNGKTYYTRGAY